MPWPLAELARNGQMVRHRRSPNMSVTTPPPYLPRDRPVGIVQARAVRGQSCTRSLTPKADLISFAVSASLGGLGSVRGRGEISAVLAV